VSTGSFHAAKMEGHAHGPGNLWLKIGQNNKVNIDNLGSFT
jgi:hypothetical protein